MEPKRIIGLLADEEKFKIIAAVSLGANTIEKIAAMTGAGKPDILKSILKIETSGLIGKTDQAGYTVHLDILQGLIKNISDDKNKKPAASLLDRFMKEGKLVTYPRAPKDQLLVLNHIIELFEYGRPYPEKEVNEKIKTVNPDYAAMRRYLFDGGFFSRERVTEPDGHTTTMYWRVKHL
jgi:hypothetical protein